MVRWLSHVRAVMFCYINILVTSCRKYLQRRIMRDILWFTNFYISNWYSKRNLLYIPS
nr:MAG TPA: hypothetical protein [Bacteriophage sp.]